MGHLILVFGYLGGLTREYAHLYSIVLKLTSEHGDERVQTQANKMSTMMTKCRARIKICVR